MQNFIPFRLGSCFSGGSIAGGGFLDYLAACLLLSPLCSRRTFVGEQSLDPMKDTTWVEDATISSVSSYSSSLCD